MNLALGTVQLGLPYGINNQVGVPGSEEIAKIFEVARLAGITVIDTAISYGDAERKIGIYSGGGFDIISKLPPFPGNGYSREWLQEMVESSLANLKTNQLYGLLLHQPAQLLSNDGEKLFHDLQKLKNDGKITKIGISIYDPSELEIITEKFNLDIVQAPLNILDRRLIESGWLQKLSDAGIEVHTRSVFLQGLLLMDRVKTYPKFSKWEDILSKYDNWLNENRLDPIEACLRFALSVNGISKVIVGIDNAAHLKEIIRACQGPNLQVPREFSTTDTQLINPGSWINLTA